MPQQKNPPQESSVHDVIDFLDLLMSKKEMTKEEVTLEMKKIGFDIHETEESLDKMFKRLLEEAASRGPV